jgi:hypothetical protein
MLEEKSKSSKSGVPSTTNESKLKYSKQPDTTIIQKAKLQLLSEEPVQKKQTNSTGIPDTLKTGVEHLSGMNMNDIRVHYNSDKPTALGALAYTQGTHIHVAQGQEKHLPHEIWHVVQQKQGRVRPTLQLKGIQVNDEETLEHEADVMGLKALQLKLETPNQQQIDKNIFTTTVQKMRAGGKSKKIVEDNDKLRTYLATQLDIKDKHHTSHKKSHDTSQDTPEGVLKDLISTVHESLYDQKLSAGQSEIAQLQKVTYKNDDDINKAAVENFLDQLETNVDKAWAIVTSRKLNPEESVDGHTNRWMEVSDDMDTNKGLIPANAGYAIESLSTKLFPLTNPATLHSELQATRGDTRPDVILEDSFGQDVSWIDITAKDSTGHINNKAGSGWSTKPHVFEVVYPSITCTAIKSRHIEFQKKPWNLEDTSALAENYYKARATFLAQKEIWVEKANEVLNSITALSYKAEREETIKGFKKLLKIEKLSPIDTAAIIYMCGKNPMSYGFSMPNPNGTGRVRLWNTTISVSTAESLFHNHATDLPKPTPERIQAIYTELKTSSGPMVID